MKYQKLILFCTILLFFNTNIVLAQTCIEKSRTCISGAATRIINGTSVYKECWEYSVNYNCHQAGNYNDNCSGIKQINGCSQLRSDCQSNLDDGNCLSYKNKYICNAEFSNFAALNLTLESQDQHIKSEVLDDSTCQSYAQNSNCSVFQDSVCLGGAETRMINGLAVARDCWNYQKKYYCKGQLGQLTDGCVNYEDNCQLQNQTCLSNDTTGLCTYTTKTYQCQAPATQTSVSCGSQDYVTSKDQNFGKAAASLAFLQGAAEELDKNTLTTFSGSSNQCGKDLVGFSNCCKMSGWGQDLSLGSCSSTEKDLAISRENRRCVYVGSYCSKKEPLTKTCLKKKESYCCFNSKLSRIINEQGRPQIGMGFGSAESPNCSGIPITDLQKIDFSKIDFSELFAELEAGAKLPDSQEMQDKISSTVQNYHQQ